MALLDQDELIDSVKNLMGSSFDKVSDIGFEQACSQAEDELGWSYPLTDARKCYWLVERSRRHVMYVLMVESAAKFQYKQIHLEHRFKHYIQLMEKMDADFAKAVDDFPELFEELLDAQSIGAGVLGIYMNSGYIYDALGRDLTYLEK